jgi:exopolysaccharide biosynthesis polyprenyl glycosylphosphotransferase
MEVGQKPPLGIGYGAHVLVSEKQPSRTWSLLSSAMVVLALALGVAVASPGIDLPTAWRLLAMLLLTIVIVPGATDILVAGVGPGVAVVSAILGNQPGSRTIYRASTVSEATDVLGSTAIRRVIVADDLDVDAISGLHDIRGVRPSMMDATDAVGDLLGRLPMQLVDADMIQHVGQSQTRIFTVVKRTIDIAFSLTLGLLVLPIIPFAALAIRLDSPGSTFNSQERVGLNGKLFRIYKLRSMRSDAEKHGAVWAQTSDPRVTRIGRFLRLTRIDELPQLWNVLRGDMTLVGPRPERPEFTSLLNKEIPGYSYRTMVKPGLTGWAQVSFRYTSSVADTRTKLEYDLYYVKNASLALDLKILLRTIVVVIKMRGC